jgi:hypothetical protein
MMVTDVLCSSYPLSLMSSDQMNLKPTERRSEPHRKDPMATESVHRSQIAKRRSSRMALNAPIGLAGEDRQKSSFTMPAKATNLNKHGAAIQLNRELQVGSTVVVRNKNGTQVSARVVAQLAARQGVPTYAIEFAEQDDTVKTFWGITFPSVESRGPTAQAEEQSAIVRRRRGTASRQD